MESDFNTFPTPLNYTEERIEIGSSGRFRYFKTRRNGVLHFVKAPTLAYEGDLITTEALRKEFILGYGLNHPNIVRYYALEQDGLYEEYIDGSTLRELIDNDDKRLHDKVFLKDMARQILEAVKYLHDSGILHLDLKPENIMIARPGDRVKIIDLSCAASAECDSTSGFTGYYRAPEQTDGSVNVTTDIYQAGLIIAELAATGNQTRRWKSFIEKATAFEPYDRFPSADEAIKGLPESSHRRSKWIIAPLCAIAMAGAFILLESGINKSEESTPVMITPSEATPVQEVPKEPETTQEKAVYPSITITPQQSDAQIENKLTKMIDTRLEGLFGEKVYPMYEKMMNDELYKNSDGVSREFVDAYTIEFYNLMAYGEELKNQYPEQATFIDITINRVFEAKTSHLLLNLYPYTNN